MIDKNVLWDRLAGELMLYVENYMLTKNSGGFGLNPSYEVDYDIPDKILSQIENSIKRGTDSVWYLRIGGCRDVNDLPGYLKKLVEQYLPRFFDKYPQYEDEKCLKIQSK